MWCSGEIFVKWLAPTYLYHVPAAKSSSRIGAARKLNLKSEVPPHCLPWAGICSALNSWIATYTNVKFNPHWRNNSTKLHTLTKKWNSSHLIKCNRYLDGTFLPFVVFVIFHFVKKKNTEVILLICRFFWKALSFFRTITKCRKIQFYKRCIVYFF